MGVITCLIVDCNASLLTACLFNFLITSRAVKMPTTSLGPPGAFSSYTMELLELLDASSLIASSKVAPLLIWQTLRCRCLTICAAVILLLWLGRSDFLLRDRALDRAGLSSSLSLPLPLLVLVALRLSSSGCRSCCSNSEVRELKAGQAWWCCWGGGRMAILGRRRLIMPALELLLLLLLLLLFVLLWKPWVVVKGPHRLAPAAAAVRNKVVAGPVRFITCLIPWPLLDTRGACVVCVLCQQGRRLDGQAGSLECVEASKMGSSGVARKRRLFASSQLSCTASLRHAVAQKWTPTTTTAALWSCLKADSTRGVGGGGADDGWGNALPHHGPPPFEVTTHNNQTHYTTTTTTTGRRTKPPLRLSSMHAPKLLRKANGSYRCIKLSPTLRRLLGSKPASAACVYIPRPAPHA